MTWHFSSSWRTRSELVEHLIQPIETEQVSAKIIAHALLGNVLWCVAEVTAKREGFHKALHPGQTLRYIGCDLLERSEGQWGFKALDESIHPNYYSCPLAFLDMAPERSSEWREGVRAYHARTRIPRAPATVSRN